MPSVISDARTESAPLKMPGNARTLLIWFGKSLLPVPTTNAPASFARSGIISGVGFAIAKMNGFSFMDFTISGVTRFGFETPINTSAPFIASASPPCILVRLVRFEREVSASEESLSPSQTMPLEFSIRISCTPIESSISAIATPAAPAPLMTIFRSPSCLPASFAAFMIAAEATTAVPC